MNEMITTKQTDWIVGCWYFGYNIDNM